MSKSDDRSRQEYETRAQAQIERRRWAQQLDGHLQQNARLREQLESSGIDRDNDNLTTITITIPLKTSNI